MIATVIRKIGSNSSGMHLYRTTHGVVTIFDPFTPAGPLSVDRTYDFEPVSGIECVVLGEVDPEIRVNWYEDGF